MVPVEDPVADLIIAVAKHDRAAFRKLYQDTNTKLMGVLMRLLGTRAVSEEALQEVFIRVWLRARLFNACRGRGMTWLITVARNHAIDRLRARSAEFSGNHAIDEVADNASSVESQIVALGEAQRLCRCMEQLDHKRVSALCGAYLQGKSYVELAAQFDVSLNTMRTQLRRSIIKLKLCMNE